MKFHLHIDKQHSVWDDPEKMEVYIRDRIGVWFDSAEFLFPDRQDEAAREEALQSAVNLLKQGAEIEAQGHRMRVDYDFGTPKDLPSSF